jgi:uncharacterized protein YjbJ (UPF0337 family)
MMGWNDKLKNKKDEAKGAAQENLGKATDDEQMEREGQNDQTVSNLKQVGEKSRTPLRSCDTRSHVASQLAGRRADFVGGVVPGLYSMARARSDVRRW